MFISIKAVKCGIYLAELTEALLEGGLSKINKSNH